MTSIAGSTASARCSSSRAWSRRADPLIILRSEAGRSPDYQPPRELLLHRQLGGELVADLDLEQVVAPLLPRCRGIRGEGIERALLVEVDQSGPAARSVGEGDQRSEEHTLTPVTNAHLVCRLLLEKKNNKTKRTNATIT